MTVTVPPHTRSLGSHLLRRAARLILRLLGWQIGKAPPDLPKYVVIGAYHTSNWDGIFLILYKWIFGVDIKFMMKDSLFRGLLGPFARWLGGIAIDRSRSQNTVQQVVEMFRRSQRLVIAISPEGTRRRTEHWKTGFYHIAQQADVPIVLAYLDYDRKIGGFPEVLMPSGDIEADMVRIREFYAAVTPKFPERAGPVVLRPEVLGIEVAAAGVVLAKS